MIVGIWRRKWQAFSLYRGRQALFSTVLRWGVWGVRCLLKRPAVVDIAQYAMRLYVLPRWKGCWKAIFVFRERFFEISDPELVLLERLLKPQDVFVDAGAYHGWYSLVASRIVGETGLVLAFEPNSESYAILERNIALSSRRNVRTFKVALAGTNREVWLYNGPGDGSPSALAYVPGGTGREQVQAQRLDDVLATLHTRSVALLKLDVQGAEADLLAGAMGILTHARPAVLFEIDPWAAQNMDVSEQAAWSLLVNLGYRFFRLSEGTLIPLHDFPVLQTGTFLNVLAVPKDHQVWTSSALTDGKA